MVNIPIEITEQFVSGVVGLGGLFVMALCRAGIGYLSERMAHNKLFGQSLIDSQFFDQLDRLSETAVNYAEQVAAAKLKDVTASNMTSDEKKEASVSFVMSRLDTEKVPARFKDHIAELVADNIEAAVRKQLASICK